MAENNSSDSWLSFGLAFVGGYCDAAGYVLAKTFTGHITGALVLAAISVAGHDWRTLLRHVLAIALFLTGVASILVSERSIARAPSRFLLPIVMGVEIVLISSAYFALTSHLTARFGLFVGCMSLALGLQNGAFSQAGGISVHTTYLTGMITSLLKTETQRYSSETTARDEPVSDQKVKLLGGIWLAFVVGATVGATMVFRLGPLGVVGAAILLLAMVIGVCVSRLRPETRKDDRRTCAEDRPRGNGHEADAQQSHSQEPVRRPSEESIDNKAPRKKFGGYGQKVCFLFLLSWGLCVFAFPVRSQTVKVEPQEPLPGPDSHETGQGPHGHLFGDWGGERTRLAERGVNFDFQYVSDSLWNLKSEQKERFASWNRFRGTVDIDFGALIGQQGLYFHATALWQGGGNLGAYLGLLTNPSGMSSANTCRLDSWWIEKRWLDERITARVGQFAGQDFYGAQHYAASFIFEPMGYALGNLFTTLESFDPPSTPAMEIRVVALDNLYVKSMVLAAVRSPFSQNPTGLVPQFNGTAMSVSEIGFTPGKKASSVRAFDNVENRKGYSGLYQFGAAYNPGKFTSPTSATPVSGNYLLYWMASQALWRVDPKEAKGLDATFAYDWSPPSTNRNNRELTAGLRFNEPLPVNFHNTMSLGYVRNMLSPQFFPPGMPPKTEQAVEFNTLLDVLPMLLLQPVVQYYANVGGGAHRAVVFGFRTKVEF
jgi:porin